MASETTGKTKIPERPERPTQRNLSTEFDDIDDLGKTKLTVDGHIAQAKKELKAMDETNIDLDRRISQAKQELETERMGGPTPTVTQLQKRVKDLDKRIKDMSDTYLLMRDFKSGIIDKKNKVIESLQKALSEQEDKNERSRGRLAQIYELSEPLKMRL